MGRREREEGGLVPLGVYKVTLLRAKRTLSECRYVRSTVLTTPTPTPAGRLASGEQRKVVEEEERDESESRRRPWRLIWTEGEGEEGGGEREGGV